MKRRWNAWIWIGFLVILAAPVSYLTLFIRYPATRDVPWVTLPIFAAGLALIAIGLRRARREPLVYRGRIAGPILMILGAAVVALFSWQMFYGVRLLPVSAHAPRVGQKAPDFTLTDQEGRAVSLAHLLDGNAGADRGARGALLIFYRGYW